MIGEEDNSLPPKEKRLTNKTVCCLCALHHAVHIDARFSLGGTLLSPWPKKLHLTGIIPKFSWHETFSGWRVCGRFTPRPWGEMSVGRQVLTPSGICYGCESVHYTYVRMYLTGWPQTWKNQETWNTQGILWTWKTHGILTEFCATPGKNYDK